MLAYTQTRITKEDELYTNIVAEYVGRPELCPVKMVTVGSKARGGGFAHVQKLTGKRSIINKKQQKTLSCIVNSGTQIVATIGSG